LSYKIYTLFIDKYRVKISFFIILACGILLRLYHIDTNSLWFDEVCTVTFDSFKSWLSNPNYLYYNMPLYFLVTDVFTLFSDNETVLRLPGAIFGILTILYVYKIARLCFNYRVALFASLIISISPFHVYYSQEARPYSMLMLFGIASTYYMIKALIQSRWKWWAAYVIIATLGLYTHLFMGFVLIANCVFLLWYWWRRENLPLKMCLLPQAAILFLFSPILIKYGLYYVNIFLGTSEVFQATLHDLGRPTPTFGSIANILIQFFMSYFVVGFVLPQTAPATLVIGIVKYFAARSVYISYAFFALVLVGLFTRWRRRIDWTYDILFAVYLMLPLLLMYLISFDIRILNLRYTSFVFPAFCILIALSIDAFRNNKIKMIFLIGIVFIDLVALSNIYYNPRYQKEQWRDIASYIQQNEQPESVILFNADYVQIAFDYYYEGNLPRTGFNIDLNVDEDLAWYRLQSAIRGYKHVWLLLSHDSGLGEVYRQTLDKHWQLEEEKKYKGIRFYRYTKYID